MAIGSLAGGYAAAYQQPSTVLVGPGSGVLYRMLVPDGMEIAFDIRWELPQVMLSMRIVEESSYSAWLANKNTSVASWAEIYGTGIIRGRFRPPFSGSWVVLVEIVQRTWPPHKKDAIGLIARIVAAPPFPW